MGAEVDTGREAVDRVSGKISRDNDSDLWTLIGEHERSEPGIEAGHYAEKIDILMDEVRATLLALLARAEAAEAKAARQVLLQEGDKQAAKELRAMLDETSKERDAAIAERDGLRKALTPFASRMMDGVMTDLRTAHSLRGPGASSEMRSDDNDLRRDMLAAIADARTALAQEAPKS